MADIIQKVKGTRDFYPEEMAFRTWLHHQIRKISNLFGYQEYEGPILEKLELYAAKSGEELVREQAYVFTDRGGGDIALRPELTPTLARMVAQRQMELVYPLRLWSYGPFWRYEQPQKGRTREFFQWNIDMIGSDNPLSDAELLTVSASFLKALGFTSDQVKVRFNNRRLMDAALREIGARDDQKALVYRLIDRRDKMKPDAWRSFALENGLSDAVLKALIGLLENHELWRESEELRSIVELVNAAGMGDYLAYDPQVIRGLLYYTGTVFEAWDAAPGGRAVLGGGRYENLVADVGGSPLSGVGFAMGDVMMQVLLEKYGMMPQVDVQPAKVVVTCFDADQLKSSHELAALIRNAGINAICYPEPAKLNKQLKYADRIGALAVLISGPDEVAVGKVTVKDLRNRTQQTVPLSECVQALHEIGVPSDNRR